MRKTKPEVRTTEQRVAELLAAATSLGFALRDAGAGVFTLDTTGGWSGVTLMLSVNHEDTFCVARKFHGKGGRWRRLGYWKSAAPAIRAASYYTSKPLVRRPPGKGW